MWCAKARIFFDPVGQEFYDHEGTWARRSHVKTNGNWALWNSFMQHVPQEFWDDYAE